MKHILLTASLLLGSAAAQAQTKPLAFPLDSATQKVTFSDVVLVHGTNKSDLYKRATLWAAKTFPSTDATVQLADAESGRLLVRGWQWLYISAVGTKVPVKLWFLVQIDAKDGRYRSIITDLEYQSEAAQPTRNPAENTLTLRNATTHTKKGELRPIFASYRNETSAAITSLQAGIKAALTASPAAGIQNKDF